MLIYTDWDFWNSHMQGSDAFAGHPLWVAEYNRDPAPTLFTAGAVGRFGSTTTAAP